jgi:hypothetical protein
MANNLLYYFLFFLTFLLFGSIIINGWFGTTRGKVITKVNGDIEKVGYLLKGWYHFWMKERKPNLIQYTGKDLAELIVFMKNLTGIRVFETQGHDKDKPIGFDTVEEFMQYKLFLEKQLNISMHIDTEQVANKLRVYCYKSKKSYIFPSWVRDMMAGCITCHASVYGTIIFFILHAQLRTVVLQEIYSPFDNPCLAIISTWIAYLFSLAYVNTVLWKQFGYKS